MKTLKQSLAHAVSLWGKTACVEDRGARFARPQSEREAAKAKREMLLAHKKATASTASREERNAMQKELDNLFHLSFNKQYIVGSVEMGMFFLIKGDGDTWDEAFVEAERKYPSKKAA